MLIRREDDPPTGEHMSKVEFLMNIRGNHRAYGPVNSKPSLWRRIVREIKDLTSGGFVRTMPPSGYMFSFT